MSDHHAAHHYHYHHHHHVVFFTIIGRIILLYVVCHSTTTTTTTTVHAVTARYRQGRLLVHAIQDGSSLKESKNTTLWQQQKHSDNNNTTIENMAIVIDNITVAQARLYCQQHVDCVSFGFETSLTATTTTTTTRFPTSLIRAHLYPFADWHVTTTITDATTTTTTIDGLEQQTASSFHSAFVQDANWHLYVNTTREMEIIPREMKFILDTLDSLEDDDGPCRDTTTATAIITMETMTTTAVELDVDSDLASSAAVAANKQQRSLRSSTGKSSSSSTGGSGGIQEDDAAARRQQEQDMLLLQEQIQRLEQECIIQLKLDLLNAMYPIVYSDQLVAAVAPYLIPKLMQLAYNNTNTSTTSNTTAFQQEQQQENVNVRKSAIVNLMVIANSRKTAPMLVQAGIFHVMESIIRLELVVVDTTPGGDNDDVDAARTSSSSTTSSTTSSSSWETGGLPILALDVISNIALHQTANAQLIQQGAREFLHKIVQEEEQGSFPALQALLALLHMSGGDDDDDDDDSANDDNDNNHFLLPQSTVVELVNLLQSSIDGDIVYGILWDLIPGPLSAIQLLIQQQQQGTASTTSLVVIDELLNAGLVEQVVRILEASCLDAAHVQASLEILHALAQFSQRAREMIALMAANSMRLIQERLQHYQAPARLAKELIRVVSHYDFVDSYSYSGLSDEL